MTEYDKKYAWIFIGTEIIAFLIGRLLKAVFDLIPAKGGLVISILMTSIREIIIPAVLIVTALIVLGIYKKNRESTGSE